MLCFGCWFNEVAPNFIYDKRVDQNRISLPPCFVVAQSANFSRKTRKTGFQNLSYLGARRKNDARYVRVRIFRKKNSLSRKIYGLSGLRYAVADGENVTYIKTDPFFFL